MIKQHKHSCSKCGLELDAFKLASGQTVFVIECYSKGMFKTLVKNKLFNQESPSYAEEDLDYGSNAVLEMLVAMIDDVPVAYVYYNDDGEINRFTREDLRGQGICRKLLEVMCPGVEITETLPQGLTLYWDKKANTLGLPPEPTPLTPEQKIKIADNLFHCLPPLQGLKVPV